MVPLSGERSSWCREEGLELFPTFGGKREYLVKAGGVVGSYLRGQLTIVARADTGIKHLDDLKGSRLNIGNPGSGTRGTWEVLEEALGWSRADLTAAITLAVFVSAFCSPLYGRLIDAGKGALMMASAAVLVSNSRQQPPRIAAEAIIKAPLPASMKRP